jgi:hypothetical protein
MNPKMLTAAVLSACVAAGATFPLIAQQPAPEAHRAFTVNGPDPAQHVRELAYLFRAGDLAGLAQAAVPPATWEEVRLAYELKRIEPVSDRERAEFDDKLGRFTAPDAVDQLMAEIEPKLDEARPKAPGALLMAFGAMQMAVASPDSQLTDEQRVTLKRALPGIQYWASSTDFLNAETMRGALTLISDGARRAGIADIDQLKAMPLENVLDRAGIVLVAAKDAVRLYGIDLDAIADSLQVDVIDIDGDTARVRTTITLFDAPMWADHDLVLVDGRWYGKHALGRIHASHDSDVDG